MSDLNTIWISSPPRTGSMWVFNIARQINKYLGFNVKPKSIPQNDSEMFDIYKSQALNEKDNDTKYVLKVLILTGARQCQVQNFFAPQRPNYSTR